MATVVATMLPYHEVTGRAKHRPLTVKGKSFTGVRVHNPSLPGGSRQYPVAVGSSRIRARHPEHRLLPANNGVVRLRADLRSKPVTRVGGKKVREIATG